MTIGNIDKAKTPNPVPDELPDGDENPVAVAIATAEEVRDPIDGLVERAADDPGAPFAPEVLQRLSAMQATGNPAWAALSTSGLRALHLPNIVREVIVLADGDDPGEDAARDCAVRWHREGRRVSIARPPR